MVGTACLVSMYDKIVNFASYVSRWIAAFLCFTLIALVFPIFPF